ncbi:MAG: cystathionine gamma-synthase [Thermoanaerobaculia bacterium]|nr:cystathionine gamma-synthase [Thermoanaerobaculia bacterium]
MTAPRFLSSFPLQLETPSAATRAVRAGLASDTQHGAVVPPIHLSSNFTFAGLGEMRRYDYTRSGNPTRDLLAEALADLEGGTRAVVTSTGMSAVHLALQLLEPGDLLIAPFDCYGGTYRLISALARRGAFEARFVDLSNALERDAALETRPKLIWVETPSNPLLRITDLREVVRAARGVGALVAVDNTFLSPALQNPLALGADLVVHSTTKYLNGHSDVVGGALITADDALGERLAWWANCLGITGAPFDSYLTLRGLRTLHARWRVHLENATALVATLAAHPAVERVFYPGLATHPGHTIAVAQQRGHGAMISFELAGGTPAVEAFLDGLELFSLAESLGGVESLVAHPATMTHAAMDSEARLRAGIGDGLLRLSVGIEASEDLERDLLAGLERAAAVCSRLRPVATVLDEKSLDENGFFFGASPTENSGLTRPTSGCILTLER